MAWASWAGKEEGEQAEEVCSYLEAHGVAGVPPADLVELRRDGCPFCGCSVEEHES